MYNRADRVKALQYASIKIRENIMENELKVGDKIMVLKNPSIWNSELNENCPLDLEFPYELTIKEINGNSMSCGKYGWDLEYIINAGYKLLPNEPQFKQGDKVLYTDDLVNWEEGIFLVKHNESYIVESDEMLLYAIEIKPYEEEIKIGDFVKTKSGEIFKVTEDKHNVKSINERHDLFYKITNPELIKLLNNEL